MFYSTINCLLDKNFENITEVILIFTSPFTATIGPKTFIELMQFCTFCGRQVKTKIDGS